MLMSLFQFGCWGCSDALVNVTIVYIVLCGISKVEMKFLVIFNKLPTFTNKSFKVWIY